MVNNDLTALATGFLNIVVPVAQGNGHLNKIFADLLDRGEKVEEVPAKVLRYASLFPEDNSLPELIGEAETLILTGLENALESTLNLAIELMNTRGVSGFTFPKVRKVVAVTHGFDPVVWDKLTHLDNTIAASPIGFDTP